MIKEIKLTEHQKKVLRQAMTYEAQGTYWDICSPGINHVQKLFDLELITMVWKEVNGRRTPFYRLTDKAYDIKVF